MPQIPVYRQQYSLPGKSGAVPMDPGAASVVGRATEEMGVAGIQAGSELGRTIAVHSENLRRQNNALVELKTRNSMDQDLRAFRTNYDADANKGEYDPPGLQKFTDTKIEEFNSGLDKYLEGVTDPDLQINIGRYRNNAVETARDHAAVYQAAARKDYLRVQSQGALDIAISQARDDGTDYSLAMDGFREKMGALHATGAVSAPDMEEIIVKADRQIVTAYLDGLIARDPAAARKEIMSGRHNQYLPEAQFRYFSNKAESLGKAEEKAALETAAFDALVAKHTDPATGRINTEAALQESQSVKKIGELDLSGLDLNTRQNIAQSIRNVDAGQKLARKKVVDAQLAQVDAAIIRDDTGAARRTILRLMADPDNLDMMDELRRSSQVVDNVIRRKEAEAKGQARDIEVRATASMTNDLYSGRFTSERDVLASAAAYGVKPDQFSAWVTKYRENARFNGMTNYWPMVISQIHGDANKLDAVKSNQGQIINSLEYYRQHPAELDKSLGDTPIDVHNPRLLDLYRIMKEKADKAAWFGYDFGAVIKTGDSFVKPVPMQKAPGKLVGTKGGKNVYELPSGQWQIGE